MSGCYGYTDIHCHILPGLDDGSQSVETSVKMAREAEATGVRAIVASVHSNGTGKGFVSPTRYKEAITLLRRVLSDNGIGVKIIPGMECFADDYFEHNLREGVFLPIRGKYLLIEFSFEESISFILKCVDISKKYGFIPIIAHPERYCDIYEKPENAKLLVRAGALLQANKGSFFGRFGEEEKAAAEYMLQNGLLFAVASDAHGEKVRTANFNRIREYLDKYAPEQTEKLLCSNPLLITESV